MKTYGYIGDHAEILENDRAIGPGESVTEDEIGPEDAHLFANGKMLDTKDDSVAEMPAAEPEQLTGEALTERAAELDIEGRSKMSADELRAAIAAAENGGE